jgi:hypothetical protein
MLLETQRELAQMRRDAEKEAEDIIAAAEREAAHARTIHLEKNEIDLAAFAVADEHAVNGAAAPSPFAPPASSRSMGAKTGEDVGVPGEGNGDEYFAFLRGALDDDQPLGPLPG